MTCKAEALIRDPLFQLNAVLWMVQPMPKGGTVEPLLYRRGFAVWAIAPPLAVPPDLRLRAEERRVALQASARPDVIVARIRDGRFALTECKAASFGPESSTAHQARSLLAIGGPRCAEVLGLDGRAVQQSLVAFLMPQDQRLGFSTALSELEGELSKARLSPGTFCFLGLSVSSKAIALEADDKGAAFFGLPQWPTEFISVDEDTDPRLLYLIPYDPSHDPSAGDRQYSKRVLFERLLASVVAATGRAVPSFDLVLEADRLLNDAMFGMYAHWQNRDDRTHMRRLCREFMNALTMSLEPIVPGVLRFEPPADWHMVVEDQREQERVLSALMRFSCEDLAVSPRRERELFDDAEG